MNESMIPVEPPSAAAVQQQYRELMQLYDSAIREVRTKLEVLDAEFRVRYARNPIHHIDTRLKSPASISEKLARKGFPTTLESVEAHLTDIALSLRHISRRQYRIFCAILSMYMF